MSLTTTAQRPKSQHGLMPDDDSSTYTPRIILRLRSFLFLSLLLSLSVVYTNILDSVGIIALGRQRTLAYMSRRVPQDALLCMISPSSYMAPPYRLAQARSEVGVGVDGSGRRALRCMA